MCHIKKDIIFLSQCQDMWKIPHVMLLCGWRNFPGDTDLLWPHPRFWNTTRNHFRPLNLPTCSSAQNLCVQWAGIKRLLCYCHGLENSSFVKVVSRYFLEFESSYIQKFEVEYGFWCLEIHVSVEGFLTCGSIIQKFSRGKSSNF